MDAASHDLGAQLREQFRVLRERKWLIVICAILTTAAALAYSLTTDKEYQATTKLLLQPSDDLGTSVVGLPPSASVDPVRSAATDLALVRQPDLAARVIARKNLDETPSQLLANVSATAEGNSNLLAITVTNRSPQAAADIANAYGRQYVKFRAANDRARIGRALAGVENRLKTVDSSSSTARSLRKQVQQLELLASVQTGNAAIIQPALPNSTPVKPRPVRNALIALLFGILLGVALAFLRDRLDPRLKKEEDVRELLPGVPTIASIPSWRHGMRGKSLEAEGFRGLQTTLSLLDSDQSIKSMLVTSATVGEGKSTTSLNLAVAMAERDESVLLLEGDLRRRGLSQRLGLANRRGVANLLRGEGELNEYVVQVSLDDRNGSNATEYVNGNGHVHANGGNGYHRGRTNGVPDPGLSGIVGFLPAGKVLRNPHTLLNGRGLTRLLHDAGSAADKVVIDGTPVGLVSDMLPVARDVDAVIVITHLYHTRRNELKRLVQQLDQAGITPFGLVVFGVESDRTYNAYMRS
jgi:succinoglycan biosynthesis transport protein ExoP